jgi:hypothetical protein
VAEPTSATLITAAPRVAQLPRLPEPGHLVGAEAIAVAALHLPDP